MKENIKNSIWILFIVMGGYWLINSEMDEMRKWPASVVKNNYEYCNPESLSDCKEDSWFGIQDSKLPVSMRAQDSISAIHLRNIFCKPVGDTPSSQMHRFITLEDGDSIFFCRMDTREKIMAKLALIQ